MILQRRNQTSHDFVVAPKTVVFSDSVIDASVDILQGIYDLEIRFCQFVKLPANTGPAFSNPETSIGHDDISPGLFH